MSKFDEISLLSKELYKQTAKLNLYIQNAKAYDTAIIKALLKEIAAVTEYISEYIS